MGFAFPNLSLRLSPVLGCLAILEATALVELIGTCRDLRGKVEWRCGYARGFGWVPNPIRKQFHPVVQEEPSQSITPDE
jgi:hypothetical protein